VLRASGGQPEWQDEWYCRGEGCEGCLGGCFGPYLGPWQPGVGLEWHGK
jgi:hypothetical protein